MKYMLLIYSAEGGWDALTPEQQAQGMQAYMAYNQALEAAGAFVAADRLQPSGTATCVRVTEGGSKVLDGPYAETKEQLGGYYLIEAKDLDGALEWASRCPGASHGLVEVRPLWAT